MPFIELYAYCPVIQASLKKLGLTATQEDFRWTDIIVRTEEIKDIYKDGEMLTIEFYDEREDIYIKDSLVKIKNKINRLEGKK